MLTRQATQSPWIVRARPNTAARLRLFCLPYAGGGAGLYRSWGALLPADVELCAIQLPGREQRLSEPAHTSMPALISALEENLGPQIDDTPYVLFGHSLGGLVAYELAQRLAANGAGPLQLFVSACPAPPHAGQRRPIQTFPDSQFIAELRRLKGTPEDVLQHEELMQLLLPTLRADFSLLNSYSYQERPPLACPIAAFAGAADWETPPDAVQNWDRHTSASFRLRILPGDHFYLHNAGVSLIQAMLFDLAAALRRG